MERLHARPRRWLWSVALAVAFLPMAAAADWPMFRGDAARTGVVGDAGASDGASPWVFPTGGPIRSSPAVVDGTVYVGSDDGNVYAVEAISGQFLWQYQTGGPVLSSPAVADGWVFVGSAFGFYQIPVDGGKVEVLYEQDAVDSSPAVADGWVYFVTRSGLLKGIGYAKGGEWEQQLPNPASSSPAVAGGQVHVFSGSNLVSVPAGGGAATERALPGGGAGDAAPAIYGDWVYFVGAVDGLIYTAPLAGGPACTPSGSVAPALPGSSPAVSSEGVVYVAMNGFGLQEVLLADPWSCPDSDSAASAAQAARGATPRASSPAVAGNAIFVGTPAGKLLVKDRSTQTTGEFPIDQPGGAIESSPAVADGFVFVGCTDGNLYAFPVGGAPTA